VAVFSLRAATCIVSRRPAQNDPILERGVIFVQAGQKLFECLCAGSIFMSRPFQYLVLIFCISLYSYSVADEQSDQHLEAFEKAYGEYQSLAKVGDFHAALPKAQISVELGELIFGDDHSNTAALSWI
jgi:hypothetical protein